jgi:hypothetical protein
MTGTGGGRPQESHRIGGTRQAGARTGTGPGEAQVAIGGARTAFDRRHNCHSCAYLLVDDRAL